MHACAPSHSSPRVTFARAAARLLAALALPWLVGPACTEPPTEPAPWPWETRDWPARVTFALTVEGRAVHLELERNDDLLAPGFASYIVDASGEVRREDAAAASRPPVCLYRGRALPADADGGPATGGWAALSLCDGPAGTFVVDGVVHSLAPGAQRGEVRVGRADDPAATGVATALRRVDVGPLAVVTAPISRPERYLELVVLNDAARNQSLTTATESDAFAIVNAVDAVFRNEQLAPALGVYVTAQVTFTSSMPFAGEAVGAEVDAASLLEAFATWRRSASYVPAADAHVLLVAEDLANGTVGLAESASVCRPGHAVVSTLGHGRAYHAAILAHELGMVLGLTSDYGDDPACPVAGTFMSAFIGEDAPTTWSPCSVAAWSALFPDEGRPDRTCLDDAPTSVWNGPRCGDGVLQGTEQCECRTPEECAADPCCDGATCMLRAGATCSLADPCCDLTCQPVLDGRVCREAEGACGVATQCDNHSAKCPPARFVAAGTPCNDGLTATGGRCFEGECVSRAEQCSDVEAYLGMSVAGLVACGLPGPATSCTELRCGTNGNPGACTSFVFAGEILAPEEGSACGGASQCVAGVCVPSASQPRCADGGPANACGGCGELLHEPGTPCLDCGTWACQGGDVVACEGCDLHWSSVALSQCRSSCDIAQYAVACLDGQGRAQPLELCAGVPDQPPTLAPCGPTACAVWGPSGQFSACDPVTGVRTRLPARCFDPIAQVELPESACLLAGPKPASDTRPCSTRWGAILGECSATCGPGVRSMTWRCQDETGAVVPDAACTTPKPPPTQECNLGPCSHLWVSGRWSECDAVDDGTRTRTVECWARDGSGVQPDALCGTTPKPATQEACNVYGWVAGPWSGCSEACGPQTRSVACVNELGAAGASAYCEEAMPATSQACDTLACSAHWVGSRGACAVNCGDSVRGVIWHCEDASGAVLPDASCLTPKPPPTEACHLPPCDYQWVSSVWSACDDYDDGTRTRTVQCWSYIGTGLQPDASCAAAGPKPPAEEACNVYDWYTGPWGGCSEPCGGGTQSRSVACVNELGAAGAPAYCEDAMPPTSQACNTQACTATWVGSRGVCEVNCGDSVRSVWWRCEDPTGAVLPDAACTTPKPPPTEACNLGPCDYQWITSAWSTCDAYDDGRRTRTVQCWSSIGTGLQPDASCAEVGPKPATEEPCNTYGWYIGPWGGCSAPCGGGTQTRPIACVNELGAAGITAYCEEAMPPTSRTCNTQACGATWVGVRGVCEVNCGDSVRSVQWHCEDATGAVLPDAACATPKPPPTEACNLGPCDYQWLSGAWSTCDAPVDGTRTRTVQCWSYIGTGLQPDASCAQVGPKPATEEACNVFVWQTSGWSPCSHTCDGGMRSRTASCRNEAGVVGPDAFCGAKPPTEEACNTQPCPAWAWSDWSTCSSPLNGTQARAATCRDPATQAVLPDLACSAAGPRPALETRPCNVFTWQTSDWSPCSHTCDGGMRIRTATCRNEAGVVGPDAFCGAKPPTEDACNTQPCPTWAWSDWSTCSAEHHGTQARTAACVDPATQAMLPDLACSAAGPRPALETRPCNVFTWQTSDWSPCSHACGGGTRTRGVACTNEHGLIGPDAFCGARPPSEEACNTQPCPTWAWSDWSTCSAPLNGTQARTAACRDPATQAVLPDLACSAAGPRPALETRPCNVFTWQTSDWSACSHTCGGGTRTRGVACMNEHGLIGPDAFCGAKPPSEEACNTQPCPHYVWATSDWGACALPVGACGAGAATRTVTCVLEGVGLGVPASFCADARPDDTRPCDVGCAAGYVCDGGACAPYDACQDAPCAAGESCGPTGPGTWICCPPGTTSDGTSGCVDVDECADGWNGGCDADVTCTNSDGGRVCGARDACQPEVFCPADVAACTTAAAPDATACDDDRACTTGDVCEAGACVGVAVVCTSPDVCLVGACDEATGLCAFSEPDAACHCGNGVRDADESDVDCGGADCLRCQSALCDDDAQCASGVCAANRPGGVERCKRARCDDGVQNGSELGVDCGGSCGARCADGTSCRDASDCASRVCDGGVCQAASCDDDIKNADESARDCGGHCGATCTTNRRCDDAADCRSGLCIDERCDEGPTCDDRTRNGSETAVDCGGASCRPCGLGKACAVDLDCRSGTCAAGVCAP